MKQSISRNLISRNLSLRNLLHLTLTLLLGLILSSSSCSKDPDPILVPATQADYYGTWTFNSSSPSTIYTLTITETTLSLTSSSTSSNYTLEDITWEPIDNEENQKETHPTGYKICGKLTSVNSFNIRKEADPFSNAGINDIAVDYWYIDIASKNNLRRGAWDPALPGYRFPSWGNFGK